MSAMTSPTGSLLIRWDPKNLEIRTKSVEKTLEPLVTQVSQHKTMTYVCRALHPPYIINFSCFLFEIHSNVIDFSIFTPTCTYLSTSTLDIYSRAYHIHDIWWYH